MCGALTFEEADRLTDEICRFLLSCGGMYQKITAEMQTVILLGIATNQHLLYRDEKGEIQHWLTYWMVRPEDVETIATVRPADITTGTVMYIVDHGNKAGRKGLTKMIQDLREKEPGTTGAVWNHKGQGMRIFMSQKGAYHGS